MKGLLQGVFVEVLRLCAEAGLVKVGRVFLDGTKVGANASLSSNRGLEKLSEEIDKILEEAKARGFGGRSSIRQGQKRGGIAGGT